MKYHKKMLLLIIPSLLGVILFYFLPFCKTFYYAVTDGTLSRRFVGMDNFITVIGNKYYIMALRNTLLFTAVSVSSIVIFSVVISFLLSGVKHDIYDWAFILPVLLPTSSIILLWRIVFGEYTDIAKALAATGSNIIMNLPLYLIYIWKYAGFNIVLTTAAITGIDNSIQEAAAIDGANSYVRFKFITLPLAMPVIFYTVVISIVNSFKIFKESILLYGTPYPPDYAYTLQYFMNNHFFKLNYHYLSSGAIIFSLIVYVIVALAHKADKHFWNY